jgi:hypothetical protein
VRSIKIKMARVRGAKGVTLHQCQLADASGMSVLQIASEGEMKATALAAFLAELALQAGNSCVVFDDPVSSLDHERRGLVACRLAALAKSRQVIVFTHDVVFLTELRHEASRCGATCAIKNLQRQGGKPGYVDDGLPWDWKSVGDRIDHLEKEQRHVRDLFEEADESTYADALRRAYSQLRATIERAIEDIVFGDVISRFRTHVKVGKLADVSVVTATHCDELIRIWKNACDVTEAHDPARAAQQPLPEPNDLLKDLEDFKRVLEDIKVVRKAAKKVPVPTIVGGKGPVKA